MLTEVCLTIDTEFSIAGAFSDPQRFLPRGETNVYCPVHGRSEGLGFILKTLGQYGHKATFFIETLHTLYFGDQPMGHIVEDIMSHGQDLQLHLHPCWVTFRHPDWSNRLHIDPPNDDCSVRSKDELIEYISQGCDAMVNWGAARPKALRTGNLIAARVIYNAMFETGIFLSSNVATGHNPPKEKSLNFFSGRHLVESVMEIPATSYFQFSIGGYKSARMLAITATSWPEMKSLLWAAHKNGLSQVVIVTHPFEFAKNMNNGESWVRNRVNQRRLQDLCEFIAEHDNYFKMATFGEEGSGWLGAGTEKERRLRAPFLPAVMRMVENKLNSSILPN